MLSGVSDRLRMEVVLGLKIQRRTASENFTLNETKETLEEDMEHLHNPN